jgi:hypothetical protein
VERALGERMSIGSVFFDLSVPAKVIDEAPERGLPRRDHRYVLRARSCGKIAAEFVPLLLIGSSGAWVPTWAPKFMSGGNLITRLCGLASGPGLARLQGELLHMGLERVLSSALNFHLSKIRPLRPSLAHELLAQALLAYTSVGFAIFVTGPASVGSDLGSEGPLFWCKCVESQDVKKEQGKHAGAPR